jgi:hypothetical protein
MLNQKVNHPVIENSELSNQRYSNSKNLIQEVEYWLEAVLNSYDDLTDVQRTELSNQVEKAKLSLHMFENLILVKH